MSCLKLPTCTCLLGYTNATKSGHAATLGEDKIKVENDKQKRKNKPRIDGRKKALEMGEQDQNTEVDISVMFYFTPAFRIYASDPISHVKKQIASANRVLSLNKIPVKMYIFCIEELTGFVENSDGYERMNEFILAKIKPSNLSSQDFLKTALKPESIKKDLLKTADLAVLMTGSPAKVKGIKGANVGQSVFGPYEKIFNVQVPVAWVFPSNPLNFVHEVGHLFGCKHNREREKNAVIGDNSNYGYLLKGSNLATIMAYNNKKHNVKIPHFSSKEHTYNGMPLGDSWNDNRSQIVRARFLVSQNGDETGKCGHHSSSCAQKCSGRCCPMYKSEED